MLNFLLAKAFGRKGAGGVLRKERESRVSTLLSVRSSPRRYCRRTIILPFSKASVSPDMAVNSTRVWGEEEEGVSTAGGRWEKEKKRREETTTEPVEVRGGLSPSLGVLKSCRTAMLERE